MVPASSVFLQVTQPSIFSPPTKSLSVIVPAYNEEDRLGATLEEIIKWVISRGERAEGCWWWWRGL